MIDKDGCRYSIESLRCIMRTLIVRVRDVRTRRCRRTTRFPLSAWFDDSEHRGQQDRADMPMVADARRLWGARREGIWRSRVLSGRGGVAAEGQTADATTREGSLRGEMAAMRDHRRPMVVDCCLLKRCATPRDRPHDLRCAACDFGCVAWRGARHVYSCTCT